jgi:hypothetical protein
LSVYLLVICQNGWASVCDYDMGPLTDMVLLKKNNTEVKLSPGLIKQCTMNVYGGVEVQLHAFSVLGWGEQSVSCPGNEPPVPFNTRLGGSKSQSGHCEERNSCSCRPANYLVTLSTELSWWKILAFTITCNNAI